MQSWDYPSYGKLSEVDVLLDLLRQERIIHYDQVEWKAFWKYLYHDRNYAFPWNDDTEYSIVLGNELESFCQRICGHIECVRLLTYFRDHAQDSVFKGDKVENISIFEKECTRLIYYHTNPPRPDEYHGKFAAMAHPNPCRIALGEEVIPKLTKEEDKIIAKHLPSYPHDNGSFSPAVIISVAHQFVNQFRAQRDIYCQYRENEDKPQMSVKAYKDYMLCTKANS